MPKPNEPLSVLAHQALNDSAGLQDSDPQLAVLRADQAEQLFGEIARLCGHNSQGETPKKCVLPTTDAVPTTASPEEALTQAQEMILSDFATVPAESRPHLARMYTQLAMLEQPAPAATESTDAAPVAPAPTSDPAAADAARAWEDQVIFGLDVALAFAGKTAPEIEQATAIHQELATALPTPSVTSPVAFDLSGYPEVTDAASAMDFLIAVESDSVERWNISATQSEDPQWQQFALKQAGNAAVRAGDLMEQAGQDPTAAEFLELN